MLDIDDFIQSAAFETFVAIALTEINEFITKQKQTVKYVSPSSGAREMEMARAVLL